MLRLLFKEASLQKQTTARTCNIRAPEQSCDRLNIQGMCIRYSQTGTQTLYPRTANLFRRIGNWEKFVLQTRSL